MSFNLETMMLKSANMIWFFSASILAVASILNFDLYSLCGEADEGGSAMCRFPSLLDRASCVSTIIVLKVSLNTVG
jgi:hypothetical protein